jgi:hypothetical protein
VHSWELSINYNCGFYSGNYLTANPVAIALVLTVVGIIFFARTPLFYRAWTIMQGFFLRKTAACIWGRLLCEGTTVLFGYSG